MPAHCSATSDNIVGPSVALWSGRDVGRVGGLVDSSSHVTSPKTQQNSSSLCVAPVPVPVGVGSGANTASCPLFLRVRESMVRRTHVPLHLLDLCTQLSPRRDERRSRVDSTRKPNATATQGKASPRRTLSTVPIDVA